MKDSIEDTLESSENKKPININIQSPEKITSVKSVRRKSGSKKSEIEVNKQEIVHKTERVTDTETEEESNRNISIIETEPALTDQLINVEDQPRPQNLQDLILRETLVTESTNPIFNLDDISDSEDIWIMDIPRTINPTDLTSQKIVLGDKSKFKIGEEKYCIVNRDVKHSITCVFNNGKVKPQYKAVNIKPVGSLMIRKKLPSIPKVKPIPVEDPGVPFPENIKTRHPLFGIASEVKMNSQEKKQESRSHSSTKKKRKSQI